MARTKYSMATRHTFWAFVMMSPWIIRFVFITAGPMLASLYFSFTDYPILSAPQWTGIANFRSMFTDDDLFWKSLGNTFYYVGISVPLNIVLSFGLAMLLNQKLKGENIYRTLMYLPAMVPIVASAVLWKWIFNSESGLSGIVFRVFGLQSPHWFENPALAKPALIIMALWNIGPPVTIFLAGLQGIPTYLYEAAHIDGAKSTTRFFRITLPIMTPVLLFNLVMGVIGSFQVFAPAYIITQGGPLNSTTFFMYHLYRQGFEFFKMGYASALSWVLFAIILIFTLFIFRSLRAWVFYHGAQ